MLACSNEEEFSLMAFCGYFGLFGIVLTGFSPVLKFLIKDIFRKSSLITESSRD